jgi:hypothetical protein
MSQESLYSQVHNPEQIQKRRDVRQEARKDLQAVKENTGDLVDANKDSLVQMVHKNDKLFEKGWSGGVNFIPSPPPPSPLIHPCEFKPQSAGQERQRRKATCCLSSRSVAQKWGQRLEVVPQKR